VTYRLGHYVIAEFHKAPEAKNPVRVSDATRRFSTKSRAIGPALQPQGKRMRRIRPSQLHRAATGGCKVLYGFVLEFLMFVALATVGGSCTLSLFEVISTHVIVPLCCSIQSFVPGPLEARVIRNYDEVEDCRG
jgi:hypothetical protein